MTTGLKTSRLINVTVSLSEVGAQYANYDSLLILGDTSVIGVGERIRSYNGIDEVAEDFSTTDPEYLASVKFFAQSPQPESVFIGRWASSATKAYLPGGVLTSTEQTLTTWTAITNGSFNITIDGTAKSLSSLSFASAANLNAVATVISTALGSAGTCTWNGQYFTITSATSGTSSSVAYATAGSSGTNIATMLKLTSTTASPPVAGYAAESLDTCVAALDNLPTFWYGLTVVSATAQQADLITVSDYIEAAGNHIHGISTSNTQVLSSTVTTDVASVCKAAGYKRTFVQYSQAAYVAASFFGRAFTVDWAGSNTTITLMWKKEPGVTPETLTASQADTLISKRCNFYVYYDNDTAILQNGVMSGDAFFDDIHGIDAFANALAVNLWNALYTSTTKIPQTDAGNHQLVTVAEATCATYVTNGFFAPGTWNIGGFGTLKQGDYLDKGYYVYCAPCSTQSVADRTARKSMPIQVAGKLAGAIHSVDVGVTINR